MTTTQITAPKRRKPRMKVYSGNLGGQREAIMACSSLKEFFAATGISRDYGGETGNPEQIAQAMSAPGVPFARGFYTNAGPWAAIPRRDGK